MPDNPTIIVAESFRRNVRRGHPRDCWPWQAGMSERGYGVTHVIRNGKRRSAAAHRVAHFLATGVWEPWSEGRLVRHLCHNPACCNPAHLMGGTRLDNSHDRHFRVHGWPLENAVGEKVWPHRVVVVRP